MALTGRAHRSRPDAGAGDTAAVALAGVSKSYGPVRALDAIAMSVARGEMFGVIGPDGAGKTTLLRLVCGLLAADRGTITVFGADPARTRRAATASIGYLSQQFSLYGDLSIDENIEFFARLHGVRGFGERRDRLLALTGLHPFRKRLADRLSGGMKQKLALACTLVHQPPLLILDEPTTGVDPVSRREFWKLLAEFRAQGLTIVIATPYLDEAERCTRVALLAEGRTLAIDDPAALQRRFPGRIVELVTTRPRQALELARIHAGADRVQLFGDRLHIRAEGEDTGEALVARLADLGVDVVSARTVPPSLEDVFIDLVSPPAASPRAAADIQPS